MSILSSAICARRTGIFPLLAKATRRLSSRENEREREGKMEDLNEKKKHIYRIIMMLFLDTIIESQRQQSARLHETNFFFECCVHKRYIIFQSTGVCYL